MDEELWFGRGALLDVTHCFVQDLRDQSKRCDVQMAQLTDRLPSRGSKRGRPSGSGVLCFWLRRELPG
jgi:hypothetical protein